MLRTLHKSFNLDWFLHQKAIKKDFLFCGLVGCRWLRANHKIRFAQCDKAIHFLLRLLSSFSDEITKFLAVFVLFFVVFWRCLLLQCLEGWLGMYFQMFIKICNVLLLIRQMTNEYVYFCYIIQRKLYGLVWLKLNSYYRCAPICYKIINIKLLIGISIKKYLRLANTNVNSFLELRWFILNIIFFLNVFDK